VEHSPHLSHPCNPPQDRSAPTPHQGAGALRCPRCHPGGVSLHDPEPPAHELVCARRTCTHPYPQHPGGRACLWWDPATGEHCGCPGFVYVAFPPGASEPYGLPRPGYVCHYLGGQPLG
jgi:hypothetical protein